jgi:hypothetical protein
MEICNAILKINAGNKIQSLKVYMHEISIVCFLTYFCIFQSLLDTKQSTINIYENFLQIRPDIRNFRSLPDFAESAKYNWALSAKTRSES